MVNLGFNIEGKNTMPTIVVSTCKLYWPILDIWRRSVETYWPEAIGKITICTDEKPIKDSHNLNVFAHKSGWCKGLTKCLESLDDEFIILLLDDYILEAPVSSNLIDAAKQKMATDQSIGVVYLTDIGLAASNREHGHFFEVDNGPYSVNSCPGLWRRSHLIETLKPFNDPWAWEAFAFSNKITKGRKAMCYTPSIYKYSFDTGGLVYRGAISRKALERLQYGNKLVVNLSDLPGFNLEDQTIKAKRTLAWKINFLKAGLSVSVLGVLKFILFSFVSKLRKIGR